VSVELRKVAGLRPRRAEIEMRNLDGDKWMKAAADGGGEGQRSSPTGGGGGNDDGKIRTEGATDEKWPVCVRHLTLTGWNCVVPALTTVLGFAPRVEMLRHTDWSAETRHQPPPRQSASEEAAVAESLLSLEIGVAHLEDLHHLPRTLSVLVVESPGIDRDDAGRDLIALDFAAQWTAAVVDRFVGLTRLHIGSIGAYSLETLTERLPQLTDLSLPYCVVPATPLAHSHLEKLACTLVKPAADATIESKAIRAGATVPPFPVAPGLLGPALHTLDLVNTMYHSGCNMGLALAASAPHLVSLVGLVVPDDAAFHRAIAALAYMPLHTLGLCSPGVTSMAPLARFAESLHTLDVDRCPVLAAMLADAGRRKQPSDRIEWCLPAVVRRVWPPLPKLARLNLHDIFNEREMRAVLERYPGVDSTGSWAADL
jgi:hypothetical protein